MKTIISDTSPLILFAKLDLLDILCRRFRVKIPQEVSLEATFHKNLPDARIIQGLIDTKRIEIKKISSTRITAFEKEWGLGKGESAVILLALAQQSVIVTDDYSAMRVAKIFQCSFVTTPVLIVEMCHQNILSVDLAEAKLDALKDYAWISSEILDSVKSSLTKRGGQ